MIINFLIYSRRNAYTDFKLFLNKYKLINNIEKMLM